MTRKILFPAIDLKDGSPRRPQRQRREDAQIKKVTGRG